MAGKGGKIKNMGPKTDAGREEKNCEVLSLGLSKGRTPLFQRDGGWRRGFPFWLGKQREFTKQAERMISPKEKPENAYLHKVE